MDNILDIDSKLCRSWKIKNTIILHATCMTFAFCLIGCGGGSGSSYSTTDASPTTPRQFSSLEINPLSDLGLEEGDSVCFKVKSYNNVTESDYSKPICSIIYDPLNLPLSWSEVTGKINGYYVYFGTNKNNATNFLADVIES